MEMTKNGVLNKVMRRNAQAISYTRSDALVAEHTGRSMTLGDRNGREKNNGYSKRFCRKMKKDIKMKEKKAEEPTLDESRVIAIQVIDSGALMYATSRRDFFKTYTAGDYGSIKMDDDSVSRVVGFGDFTWGWIVIWAYTLKMKSQAFNIFKQFHALVEREIGKKLKCIRIDNGGEYIEPVHEYFTIHGIRHELTPLKPSHLNGLAERMNKTLLERALSTVVHVLNILPCVPLDFEIPNKVWSGKEVSYYHLEVFGCKAFVNIPENERSKLNTMTRQYVFIGYGEDQFCYRFYDPIKNKIIRSKDIIFMETQTIEDIDKIQKTHNDVDLIDDPLSSLEGSSLDEELFEKQRTRSQREETLLPSQRKSTREKKPSTKYPPHKYVFLTETGEVSTRNSGSKRCRMRFSPCMRTGPKGKRPLKNKCVFQLKHEEHNSRPRYKARLVVKGFSQKKGINSNEIFSPVVKITFIRLILAWAASLHLEVEQMDMKTAFLRGDLEEEIYMEQPQAFEVKKKEDTALRQWYKKFESVMRGHGQKKIVSDHCVFVTKFARDDVIILLLYIDDTLIIEKNIDTINMMKKQLSESFAIKDLGPTKKILGVRKERDRDKKLIWLSQKEYIEKILCRFHLKNLKVSPSIDAQKNEMEDVPYVSIVGSLMYAMCVALSTAEAEFIAVTEACKELLWFKKIMKELMMDQKWYVLLCDSQSAIYICKNSSFHSRTKHIGLRYHWIQDALEYKAFEIEKVHTNENGSDMMMKVLPKDKLLVSCVKVA
ncbi:Retrovirus-related Pol polyprotein from transposon TNT 1-94-like protein [Drosera capensis]